MQISKGSLILIPTPLGDVRLDTCLPENNQLQLLNIKTFIVEELRTARRFLRKAGVKTDFEEITFLELNEHTLSHDISNYLDAALKGENIGLLSEAGLPCVADPGSLVVALAHQKGIRVKPLVGPSSILLALMASGMDGQNFTFHGYLPVKPHDRTKALKTIELDARKQNQTQIFIETPYRNQSLLDAIVASCQPDMLLCIACDLTTETEFIRTQPIRAWKKTTENLNKRPAIFLLGYAM